MSISILPCLNLHGHIHCFRKIAWDLYTLRLHPTVRPPHPISELTCVSEPGEEILATYGAHSNDKLLVHYGFVPITPIGDPSPDDDVRLDHLIITRLSEDIQQHLQDLGFLGAYALIPATNELCFRAQVAVRAALLTCTEWEFFATNGEDLASDQSHAVKNFLRAQMKGTQIFGSNSLAKSIADGYNQRVQVI